MEKINEIRQALMEAYDKSFNLKEPTASLFSEIEVLTFMIEEDPEVILSYYDGREIQMYNYLINEMIMELRKRNIARINAERNVVNIRKPRPITAQPNSNPRIVQPNFEIPADLANFEIPADLANFEFLAIQVEPPAMDQRNLTPDLELRANSHHQTSSRSIAPAVPPHSEIEMDERSLDIAHQKRNIAPPPSENIDKEMFPSTSEEQLFRNLEEIGEHRVHSPFLTNVVPVEERELIRNFDLQTSDAIRSGTMPKTSEMQQFGNIVDSEEALVTMSDLLPPLTNYESSKQRFQIDVLEADLPEIPAEDVFIQEFRALFERRRRERAATDYAERATRRAKRSLTNFKCRDLSRKFSPLIRISDEVHTRCVMPLFSQESLILSEQIQVLLQRTRNQEWDTEFSNLIENKPQSTPQTPFYGQRKTTKWTSSLPVLEEDQMGVQRAAEVSGDQNQIIIQSKPTESDQTPLTAKNTQRAGRKLTRSTLPVLQDEIEPLPAAEIEPLSVAEIEPPPEMFVETDWTSSRNERLRFKRNSAKRPKLTTEKAYPTTQVQNLREDAEFQQYFQSWKRSILLNTNDPRRDIHFPVDLLKMLDVGTSVHQLLKILVDSEDIQLNYFLSPTSTRKEAAKRIKILLELQNQNVLDFITKDGKIESICIKH